MKSILLLSTLFLAHCIHAWGDLGHETIAWIAQSYISSTTKSAVQQVLGTTDSDYMAHVATWADKYRYTAAGRFSAPFHFIDADDSPPSSCSVDFDRDCGDEGCSVSAMVNYTSILLSNSGDTYEALKFVIHFVGDIHQPLHDEKLDVGGNDIAVTYNGSQTNLHHIWDTQIVEALAGGATAESFATSIVDAINSKKNGWTPETWVDGMDIGHVQSTALGWAADANQFVCSNVLVNGVESVENADLSGQYYDDNHAVALTQIAKAGYRLGAWLDLVYSN